MMNAFPRGHGMAKTLQMEDCVGVVFFLERSRTFFSYLFIALVELLEASQGKKSCDLERIKEFQH
ncbi:hypothetical protein Scep_003805 [Stephania cephalantha]|uniref:Uncharacterized protein n=1 Tax=Stephania cephalantha TaxID=152367 RepID=A0AAP0KRB1_9MAGN